MSNSRSEATRAAILDATLRLLERDGFHAVGLADVAGEAGVTRQLIYFHFRSKAKLLKALMDVLQKRYVDPAFERRRVWDSASGLEALDAWVDVAAATTPPLLAVANALDAARRSDPEAEAIWRRPMKSRYEGCLRIARWLERDGSLAPGWEPEEAARFLWTLSSFRVYEDLTSHGWSRKRYAEHLRRSLHAVFTTVARDA